MCTYVYLYIYKTLASCDVMEVRCAAEPQVTSSSSLLSLQALEGP